MSRFYTILYLTIVSASIFAMDRKEANDRRSSDDSFYNPKKEDNPNKAPSYSYHMEPALSEIHANTEKGEASATYKYSDGSKTTYYRYKDS